MAVGNLTAWKVEASSFPGSGTAIEKARFAVAYAILAPSSHNTQPWRFISNGDELLVCADRTRSLANIDPFDRELIISCGAALFNLRVALAHFEVPVEITTFPQSSDPDIVARVVFPGSGAKLKDLAELFDAITKRATNRGPFSDEAVPAGMVELLKSAAASEGVDLAFAQGLGQRERLAGLIANADQQQFDDPRFRRELASWIHPSRSNDGMPAASQGLRALTDAASPIVAMAIRTFDLGTGVAAAHQELARGSPLLVALSTPMDSNEVWLQGWACSGCSWWLHRKGIPPRISISPSKWQIFEPNWRKSFRSMATPNSCSGWGVAGRFHIRRGGRSRTY